MLKLFKEGKLFKGGNYEEIQYSHLSNKRDVTLTDFEKFHPTQIKNPPYTFIDFLDFSTLHSTFIRFMY